MKLFYSEMSSAARAVLLTVKALRLDDIEFEEVLIYSKTKLNANLLQINPKHSVPTLIDGNFISWDCYQIVRYLVGNYGQRPGDIQLYPPELSTLIDQKLYFDRKVLHPCIESFLQSIVIDNEKELSPDKIMAITEAYDILNNALENKLYLVEDQLTLADLCIVATISTATLITPISKEKYPNLSNWYRLCKNLPYYYDGNAVGLNKLDALVERRLERPRIKPFSV